MKKSKLLRKRRDSFILYTILVECIIMVILVKYDISRLKICHKDLSELYNVTLTYGTIMVAIFVLCYSILDLKKLGVSNRTCLRYILGNLTLPALFIWIIIKLPVIYFFYLGNIDQLCYVEIILTLLQEFIISCFIVIFSSMRMTINAIAVQEKWQFHNYLKQDLKHGYMFSPEIVTHVRKVMESDEFFSDKVEVLKKIVMIPIRECKKSKVAFSNKEWETVYNYYYENAYSSFAAVKASLEDRQKLYNFFYVELQFQHLQTDREKMSIDVYKHIIHIATAAVMDAAVMSEVIEAEAFCTYLLDILYGQENDMAGTQIAYYVLMLQLLSEKGSSNIISNFKFNDLDKFLDNANIDEHINELLDYWYLITRNCTIETENVHKIFNNTILSLKGESNDALIASYIHKKRDCNKYEKW